MNRVRAARPRRCIGRFRWRAARTSRECARHALAALEERAGEGERQVDLFATPEVPESAGASPVEAALAGIHPDQLSPREALDALYQLKKLAGH